MPRTCWWMVVTLIGCGQPAPASAPEGAAQAPQAAPTKEAKEDPVELPPIGECDPATDIEYCAFLPLVEKIHATPGKEAEVFASLSIGQRALYATWALEGDVNNGGFNQYFFNEGDHFTEAAIEGFKLFGATEHAEIAQAALDLYRADKERVEAVRKEGSLEAFSKSYEDDPYDALDERFFKLDAPRDARTKYIHEHMDQFPGLPKPE